MSAIPLVPDDDQVLRQRGIPLAQDPQAPVIALPPGAMPSLAIGKPPLPLATSNRGIGVVPQTQGRAIPIDPATNKPEALNNKGIPMPIDPQTGQAEPLNNKGIPIRAGVAGLWAKADNIQNPVLRVLGKIGAGAARAIDVAGQATLPGLESKIPGSVGYEKAQNAQTAAIANNDANLDYKKAETANVKSETDARENPQAKVGTPEEQTFHDLMTGDNGKPKINPETGKTYEMIEAFRAARQAETKDAPSIQQSGQGMLSVDPRTGKATPVTLNGQPVQSKQPNPNDFDQFYADYIKDNNIHDSAHNRLMARKAYAAAGQAPQHDQRQLAVGPDGTVIELRPGMKVPQGSKTMAGDLAGSKPSADEVRRADLAENLNENMDRLEDIVTRRPELFGPVNGRLTEAKMAVGSDDPDIAELANIKHQAGMAQISAHGMRSAHGVDAAAAALINLHNGPDGIRSSIKSARDSVKTFTNDVERKTGAGKNNNAASEEPTRPPNVPAGYIYKDGPKGKGWYKP